MKLGINTYTYMWSIGFRSGEKEAGPARPMSAFDLLNKARELNVRVVQVGPNLPLDTLRDEELTAFTRQALDWNIELELGTRGLETDHLRRQLALAQRMGARLLRTVPEVGGQPVEARDLPPYLRAILPDLVAMDINLGLENGRIPCTDLAWAVDEVGSPLIGIVLDMVNSLAVPEGWKQVAETLAPHTMCLHFKDFIVQRAWHMMGFMVEGRPAGSGQLDIPWLFNVLKASKYDFNVIIELWPPEQRTVEETIALEQAWAVESVHNLRKFISD